MPFDFSTVSAPFRMQPGLRRLMPGATQLTPNRPGCPALLEKLAVLGQHASQALTAVPDFDAKPALRALALHAAQEHPAAFAFDGADAFDACHLGWSLRGDSLHGQGAPEIGRSLAALSPGWRLAGLLSLTFAEDFAVIDGASGRIPWLAVCLPSRWSPQDKVGRSFAEVHAPVAENTVLVNAGPALTRLVTGPDRWERFVWTITNEPRLDAHPMRHARAPWPAESSADALAAHAFFRTERQTFIPLEALCQAVFTIHVEVQPLAQAVTSGSRAAQLHAALTSMSPEVLAYRSLATARDRLLRWLADLGNRPATPGSSA